MPILFLDIETVSQKPSLDLLPAAWQEAWQTKHQQLYKDSTETPTDSYARRAAIYAEFGRVIVISCGYYQKTHDAWQFRIKTFQNHDEKQLLQDFASLLNKNKSSKWDALCAHNGKEFDLPYLCRRMIVYDIPVPTILNQQGVKPWENPHLDTLDLWKFGDKKSYISLKLLCLTLGIPSPKDDISGANVHDVYYINQDLQRIATYCAQDVYATAQAYAKLSGNLEWLNATCVEV